LYQYQDQDGVHTITRAEILAQTFVWWSEQMRQVGKADLISEEACVEDFIVVHWAWEIKEPS
jgi:hypothetical protein